MGGFFGITSKNDCVEQVFFGTDYHSHLGTKCGGIAACDSVIGLQRVIHHIEKAPFRTKFEHVLDEMKGNSAIGAISDSDPQPLLIRSKLGTFAICTVGAINNPDELIEKYLSGGHGILNAMTGGRINTTELVASLISQKDSFAEGIKFVGEIIDGSMTLLILKADGSIIAARDKLGRLPVIVGKSEDGYAVTFESFAYEKFGYTTVKELGPGEIVELTCDSMTQLQAPGEEMRICAFLWTYYGYPTSVYEGKNVETMRYRNGAILAENDAVLNNTSGIDYVCGVPDSGTPHAIGYSNNSHLPFARPFIKYTPTWPRSFMSSKQAERRQVAKMKQIPIHDLIVDKNLMFIDDSIVRGTQLKETVDFLYESGAKTVHMRSACPPIMYGCKYLNFSRATGDMELITRRVIFELEGEEGFNHIEEYSDASTERGRNLRNTICEKFHFDSLEFQSLEGAIKAIGIEPCKLCTYCWNGKK